MSLDGIVTRALVHELQPIVGARIHKIHQPTEHEIMLHVRGHGHNGKLLLSAHPSMPRIHWTEQTWDNPQEPPMFCMLLRKHCEGGVIEAIRQRGLERIVELDVRHRDELGDFAVKRLVLELMGRHSNLILLDPATGVIHDGIRHVTPAISSYRIVMPGTVYVAPPEQDKADPLAEPEASFRASILPALDAAKDGDAGAAAAQAIVGRYTGVSPLIAREIVFRASGDADRLWPAFYSLMQDAAEHRYAPTTVETTGGKTVFSAMALTHLDGDARTFDSIHRCLEAYYRDKSQRDLVRQRTADLSRLLMNETAKNEKKLLKLQESLDEAREADRFRRLGELLTAQLHLIRRGDASVQVTDYYEEDQPIVEVPLDPQLSPSENAQRYFRKYNKLKNSKSAIDEQMEAALSEIAYLASVLQGLDTAAPRDIEEIREELAEQGYIRLRASAGPRKKKKDAPSVLVYTSSEGVPIYVGKNNVQNDYVTNRLGQPADTWLHTKDIPGSHVLIRGSEFGETTLHEAAMLAAYYSKAKQSSRVPVDYTLIRHVRKPSGAKPGYVIYDSQKTLYVTPDEAAIQAMPCTVK